TINGYGTKNLVQLTVKTASGSTGTLVATDHHPFWVANMHTWRNATDLMPGDLLRTGAGTYVQVTAVSRWTATNQAVRNLTVDTLHTFYVLAGTTPVLVHNCGSQPYGGAGGARFTVSSDGTVEHVLQPTRVFGPSEEVPGMPEVPPFDTGPYPETASL